MAPVVVGGWTVGAVVASKSTFQIPRTLRGAPARDADLFASILVAVLVTIFFATTIVRPPPVARRCVPCSIAAAGL
jgi:hypothetical protein